MYIWFKAKLTPKNNLKTSFKNIFWTIVLYNFIYNAIFEMINEINNMSGYLRKKEKMHFFKHTQKQHKYKLRKYIYLKSIKKK